MHLYCDGGCGIRIIHRCSLNDSRPCLCGLDGTVARDRHSIATNNRPLQRLVRSIIWRYLYQGFQIGSQIVSHVAFFIVPTARVANRFHWDSTLRHIHYKALRHLRTMLSCTRIGIVCQIVMVVDADSDRCLADTNGTGLHTQLVRFLVKGVTVDGNDIIGSV